MMELGKFSKGENSFNTSLYAPFLFHDESNVFGVFTIPTKLTSFELIG